VLTIGHSHVTEFSCAHEWGLNWWESFCKYIKKSCQQLVDVVGNWYGVCNFQESARLGPLKLLSCLGFTWLVRLKSSSYWDPQWIVRIFELSSYGCFPDKVSFVVRLTPSKCLAPRAGLERTIFQYTQQYWIKTCRQRHQEWSRKILNRPKETNADQNMQAKASRIIKENIKQAKGNECRPKHASKGIENHQGKY
jgi:hypothetical protein